MSMRTSLNGKKREYCEEIEAKLWFFLLMDFMCRLFSSLCDMCGLNAISTIFFELNQFCHEQLFERKRITKDEGKK